MQQTLDFLNTIEDDYLCIGGKEYMNVPAVRATLELVMDTTTRDSIDIYIWKKFRNKIKSTDKTITVKKLKQLLNIGDN